MTTLYRKYRPSLFSELSGQEHIIQTLTNAIKNSNVSHAYLFTGPRGTGKTTTARLFAKTINCLKPITNTKKDYVKIEPCNQCSNCKMILEQKSIDLIEIDAASHTGVDNIRQLREAIDIPPTTFKYKVYIIDEVHMLSMGAFNALLKTLEEPPAHAIFILATTELHKVPDTIISRCQQFNVRPLTKDKIVARLNQIAKKEKIKINKEALQLIATEADGGMRDAESLFGQIISLGKQKISPDNIQQILGISPKDTLLKLVLAIANGQIAPSISVINKLQNNGINIISFNKQLLNYFRNLILTKIVNNSNKKLLQNLTTDEFSELKQLSQKFKLSDLTILISLLQNSLTNQSQADIPQLPLEMALIEYFLKTNQINEIAPASPTPATTLPATSLKKKSSEQKLTPAEQAKSSTPTNFAKKKSANKHIHSASINKSSDIKTIDIVSNNVTNDDSISGTNSADSTDEVDRGISSASESDLSINNFLDKWAEVLEGVKEKSLSIAGVLKNCAPTAIDKGSVLIKVNHTFGKERLNNSQSRLTIEKVFANIFKVRLKAKFLTEDELPQETIVKNISKSNDEKTDTIHNDEISSDNNELLYEAMKKIGGKIVKG